MTDTKTMTCAHCGRRRAWPDGFPSRLYAECWLCWWDAHNRREHAPKPHRRWRLRRLTAAFDALTQEEQ